MGDLTTITATVADVLPSVEALQGAYESKNWALLAGLVLTGLVALSRRLGLLALVPKEATKWVAIWLAMLGAVGAGLVLGMSWLSIVATGLSTGLMAIGGWESLGKMFKPKAAAEPAAPEAP